MIVIVIPLALILLVLVGIQRGLDWRQAIIGAALVAGVWLAVITEVLSIFHAFNTLFVALSWGGLAVAMLVIYRQRKPIAFKPIRLRLLPVSLFLLLCGVGLIAIGVGVTALSAPPNNWDSMTYHMSRVVHWIQNGDIAFYPTYIVRQLYQPPFAEWFIAHLQMLSGGDYLANLVQYFCWLGCLTATSLIARELDAKQRGQILTVVVAISINMGILQASSTQNDLVAAFWILCVVFLSLYGMRNGFNWVTIVGLGVAIGLSALTKGTTYVYIVPFILWVVIYAWRKQRRDLLKYGFVLVGIGLLLNIGQFSRNLRSFGSPMGGETNLYANQAMSPALWLSVAIRNVALHVTAQHDLDTRIGLSNSVNQFVAAAHSALGLAVDDPRVTWLDSHFSASYLSLHEDHTSSPTHLVLAILAFGLLAFGARSFRISTLGIYGWAIVLSFVLFCLMLRWQPWNNRLHVPAFMLLAPFITIVLDRHLNRFLMLILALYLLFVISIFPTVYNQTRVLLGPGSVLGNDRWTLMFNNRPELQASYTSAIEITHQLKCDAVGLQLDADTWEYPLWARAAEETYPMRFTYVKSLVPLPPEFETCAVIASKDSLTDFGSTLAVGTQTYSLQWNDDNLAVYRADS